MNPGQSLILRLRKVVLINSCIYYHLNSSVISDDKWQYFAEQLIVMQERMPNDCEIGYFDEEFENFDGTTGHHLPLRHPDVLAAAELILKNRG